MMEEHGLFQIILAIDIDQGDKYVLDEWDGVMHKEDEPIQEVNNKLEALKKDIIEMKKMINGITNCNMTMPMDIKINQNMNDDAVFRWLMDIVTLPQYYDTFMENGFDDMKFITNMKNEDLQEIGVDKLGHRKRIIKCINDMKNT